MRNTRGKLLAAGIVVALIAVAAQVNPTPANAPAPECRPSRDCYVNRKMMQYEREARERLIDDLESNR